MSLFAPVEGQVAFYYGRIRNGKTYAATADILELLERGEIVYANWNVQFTGYDEREHWWVVLVKTFFGRDTFYRYDASNFHYFAPDDIDVQFLNKLVGVHIFIDEGQWLFNSHVREQGELADAKRRLILHNGHHCRSLNIISQRPSNVFKDMRSQVNVWYKCVKRLEFPWLVFEKWTFEDMKDDMPDEDLPVGRPKTYFASKRVMAAYSTHAMRDRDAIDPQVDFDVYRLTLGERLEQMIAILFGYGRATTVAKPRGGVPQKKVKVHSEA